MTFLQSYIADRFRYRQPNPERAALHERIDRGHDEAFTTIMQLVNELAGTPEEHQGKTSPYALISSTLEAYAQELAVIFDSKLSSRAQSDGLEVISQLELARMCFNLHVRRILTGNRERHTIVSEFAMGCQHLLTAKLWANRTVALELGDSESRSVVTTPPEPVDATPQSSMEEVKGRKKSLLRKDTP